jgi:hypothetical protein
LTTADENDRIRALVLRAFYDVHDQMPGNVEQTGVIAERLKVPKSDVDKATLYLADRNLITIGINKGFIGTTERIIFAEISGYGIDVIERPQDRGADFLELGVIEQIINVNGTYVASGGTVYQGGQQIVGGDNTGVMVNASTTGDIQPPATPFPIDKLRELLSEGSVERQAAEDLAAESRSPSPKMSRVSGAIELLKNLSKIPGAVVAVSDWLKTPDVAAWLHSIVSAMHV